MSERYTMDQADGHDAWFSDAGQILRSAAVLSRLNAQDVEIQRLRDLLHDAYRMLDDAVPMLAEARRYLRAAREA